MNIGNKRVLVSNYRKERLMIMDRADKKYGRRFQPFVYRIFTTSLILALSLILCVGCGEKEIHVEDVPEQDELVQTNVDNEFDSDIAKNGDDTDDTSLLIGIGKTIVIDPGHQGKGNPEKEPIAPGATEMKAKVASGTTGRTTGVPEYQLTLDVALKLKEALVAQGYEVLMTRETNDVNISNAERAQIANNAKADAFIRIHANGSEDSSVSGTMTLCQTESNPYNGHLFKKSYALSEYILDGIVEKAGSKKQYVWETDTMSGINWCTVPVTIVEMGYMTNPEEDTKMQTEEYQQRIVEGIVSGLERYFRNLN